MKTRERWNRRLPLIRTLTKRQRILAIRLINLNRRLRNLDKFGPLAKSQKEPGKKWLTNQRKMWKVRTQMLKTMERLFFY